MTERDELPEGWKIDRGISRWWALRDTTFPIACESAPTRAKAIAAAWSIVDAEKEKTNGAS